MNDKRLKSPLVGALLFILFTVVELSSAHSNDLPLRRATELWEPVREEFVRVSNSRVIYVDYDLLRQDFPELRFKSPEQIDAWILEKSSFIAIPQANQSLVNSPIPTTQEKTWVYRPREYRRGAVFNTGNGLLDAKGTGAVDPAPGGHENGLATLGEMIREYLYEKLIHRIFQVSNSRFSTVQSYAVVDFGFDVIHEDGSRSRAGYVLRQAHNRHWPGYLDLHGTYRNGATQLPTHLALEVESLLRMFGVTSAIIVKGKDYEILNIQGTPSGAIIDFGSFLVRDSFTKDVAIWVNSSFGIKKIWKAHESPQPQAQFRVPFDLWGTSVSGVQDPKKDNPFIWSHELAASLANGTANREAANQHLNNLISSLASRMEEAKEFFRKPRRCQDLLL